MKEEETERCREGERERKGEGENREGETENERGVLAAGSPHITDPTSDK